MKRFNICFGELVVFGSIFFGFDHVSTKDEGGEVFVIGLPIFGDRESLYYLGEMGARRNIAFTGKMGWKSTLHACLVPFFRIEPDQFFPINIPVRFAICV